MFKKFVSFLLVVTVLFLCMCFSTSIASAATIVTYTNTPGAVQSSVFSVKAEGTSIFVESFQAIDYARFAAGSGSISVEITANENISTYKISPATADVTTGIVNGNKLTITIPSVPFQCAVKINNLRLICIFADPLEISPPQITDSNVVNVMDFVTDNTGATDQHDKILNAINAVCSIPGKDTLYFPNGTYLSYPLLISNRSNLKIYLSSGALLKTTVANPTPFYSVDGGMSGATIRFQECNNCQLFGRGVIDSQGRQQYDLNGQAGSKCGIENMKSTNMIFKDLINRNANTWQFANGSSSNSTIYNVKDICTETGTPYSTDGLSLHNCHDITVDYMFAMAKDDVVVVSSANVNSPCYNITIDHFAGYGVGANSIAMGCTPYPGSYVSNITIQNSHFRADTGGNSWWYQTAVKIETGPTYYENIRFKNIKFDNNNPNAQYFTTKGWPDGDPTNIYVKGDLEFSDCTIENPTSATILGDAANKINNLIVKNLKIGGKVVSSLKDAAMTVENVKSVDFSPQSSEFNSPHLDEFNTTTLNSAWSLIRQDTGKWSLTENSGNMRLTSDGGDLYQAQNNTKNVLVRNAPIGDWSIYTKVKIDPNTSYSQAGLVVYKDDDNYIKLTRCFAVDGNKLNFAKETGQVYSDDGFTACNSTTVYLKITKIGTDYSLYYNIDGGSVWTRIKQYTGIDFGTSFKVGIICQSTAVTADFDWFDIAYHTDEFNSTTLGNAWGIVRQDTSKWSLSANPSYLRLTSDGELYLAQNNTKNLFIRNVPSGDWSIYTKVTINPNTNYSQAGLIIYGNDDNYIKLVRCYGDGSNSLNYAKEINQVYSDYGFTSCSSTTVYLKITKSGTTYTLYYNTNGGSTWTQVKQYTGIDFNPIFFGLICQSATVDADFDWFQVE